MRAATALSVTAWGPASISRARAASTAARRLSSGGQRFFIDIYVSNPHFLTPMTAYTPIAANARSTPPIKVRDRRFGRETPQDRWWAGGDPIATAWFNALSATFPRGETLFIDSVKAFREGAPADLDAEIRAFIRQEVNHTREHLAFNRAAAQAGYDMSAIDARVEKLIGLVYERPKHGWLAVTMALEHFTAMFAHEFLTHPEHFAGADG